MEKKNYYSIDILKFFCMICVVALHTNPIHDISNTLIISVYYSIVKMAVPCFFLSSGFLIANRLKTNQKYLKTYFLRKINLYIFWNIVYLPLTLYHMLMNGISIKRGILIFIRGFFLIGQQYNSWQLWYLLSTIYSIGIILLIQKYTKLNLNHIILIGIIFYIIDMLVFQTKTFGIEAFAFTLILSLLISKFIESKKGKKL